jgi:outer membrane protein assembly factor BamB
MKGHVSRIIALIVLTILITVSYVILVPNPLKTLNDEPNGNETYIIPNLQFGRATRAGTPWPMHLNNPVHTSYTPDTGPITSDVLWFNSTGGTTYGSPAVVNDKVFIGSKDNSLNEDYMNAFYANNGTLAWRTKTIANVPGGLGVTSSPAVDSGYVFFGGDGIYSLYENNGTIKWFVDTPAQNWGDGTPTVANGRVYIGGSDRKLYAVDQDTGNVNWTFQTLNNNPPLPNYGLYAAPAVSNGYVILAACDGFVYKINETQPTPIATADYSFDSQNSIYSSPLVVNGRVYFGNGYYSPTSTSNRFYCLYENNLTSIWKFYPGSATSFFSSAGFYNDIIYVGSIDGNLYALDYDGFKDGVNDGWTGESLTGSDDGDVIWYASIGKTWSSPAITTDRLYIGSRDEGSNPGYFYSINLTQPISPFYYWRYNTEGDVDSSPAVIDGKVYVGTQGNGGRLYCFGSSVVPTVDRIEIKNQSGGLGSPIPDFQTADVGTTITGYAAAYNGTDYLYDVPVNWSVTNGSGANASTNPTSSVISSNFYSGYYGGTANWIADDGNGHIDEVQFTINPPGVDYIRIVDTEGTGKTEIGDKIVDVGNTTKGYAASFNDTTGYIGDVPVTWSVLNMSGAEGFTTPVSGSNSTLNVGLKNGTVEWIANYGLGRSDSVNFTVRKPTVDFITIMTGPNGTGSWVGDSTFVYGNSSTFYAGGFNETSGWVEDVPALWSSNNSFIGDVDPGPSTSTTFITLNNGTCNITAINNTFSNSTGVLTIINYTVDYIIIRDASNNGGVWIGDRSFNVGETANFFAAAYNYSAPDDGYIGDISVDWESSDPSIATITTPGASTLFSSQLISGECNVTARYGPIITNTTGRLTVLPADLDYIVITDAQNGNELFTVYLNVGENIQIYASGYNSTGPTYVGPVNVDWTQSPLTIGSFSQSPSTSTIFTAGMSGGSTTIIANHTLSAMNDDFTLIINPPTVDYIQIRDAADGLGNIVTTRTYIVNETDQFYAAAYNNTANYLYDVFVFWYSNDTDVGQVTPQGWTAFVQLTPP